MSNSMIVQLDGENKFDQSPETYENIIEYFNNYIKTFHAYKDEPTYKALMSFIIKNYIQIIYNEHPKYFKKLFEKQTIEQELIDLLLVSIGLPEEVIKNITTTSKFIILKSFSDFMRYKGTIKLVRSLGGAFSDVVSYYELYVDYDHKYQNEVESYILTLNKNLLKNNIYFLISSVEKDYYVWFNMDNQGVDPSISDRIGIEISFSSNEPYDLVVKKIISELNKTNDFYVNINSIDVILIQLASHGPAKNPPDSGTSKFTFSITNYGKEDGAWILRPRPIYVHPKMKILEEVIPYKVAYDKIPSLLISEDQLSSQKSRNELILPNKTNILLMDYTSSIYSSYLQTLFFTILMEQIGDDYFPVFFTGSTGTMTITYNTAIFLWYYLLAKYYNCTLEGVDLYFHNVMGTQKISKFTLEDLPLLKDEYDKIKSRDELYQFYYNNIESVYGKLYENEKPTLTEMNDTLRKMNEELWEYVENRFSKSESVEQDVRFLLDEIYASLVLSFDKYKNNEIIYEYIPIILNFLPQITTNIKITDSYKIIYNLKPFHTEILDLIKNKIIIDDKFNSLLLDDELHILFLLVLGDILHLSDKLIFYYRPGEGKDASTLSLMDSLITHFRYIYEFTLNYDIKIKNNFIKESSNILHLSDQMLFKENILDKLESLQTLSKIEFSFLFDKNLSKCILSDYFQINKQ